MATTLITTTTSIALTALSAASNSTASTSYIYATPTYNSGDPTSGSAINNDDGASGSDAGAWALSHGAIVAISVIVALVAAFGIASIVLYYVAKKRQWEVRKSLIRVSRRLTGRDKVDQAAADAARKSRRHGTVCMESPLLTSKTVPGDLEKGGVKKGPQAAQIELETSPKRKWKGIAPPSWAGKIS